MGYHGMHAPPQFGVGVRNFRNVFAGEGSGIYFVGGGEGGGGDVARGGEGVILLAGPRNFEAN